MAGLFALCFTSLWTGAGALTESYGRNATDQFLCTLIYHKAGVCKSIKYDMQHLSCTVKNGSSETVAGHNNKILTFKKVSMCVPVCDGSCDGLTIASSVGVCKLQQITNKTETHQSNLLPLVTEATVDPFHVAQCTSLHQACEMGNLCVAQFILSQSPDDINTRNKLGKTPVMTAVMNNQTEVFDFLVSQNCDLGIVDGNNDTVLHLACLFGNVGTVRKLVVNHKSDTERRGGMGLTPVMKSAHSGQLDVLDFLVNLGCNVKTLDDNMNNILHVACFAGHVHVVKYILRNLHVDIESKGEKGRTTLMIAAHRGHVNIFDFLVSKGSNLSVADYNKDNILHVACIGGNVKMVEHVLNKTPMHVESKAKQGRTPVMRAAQHDQKAVVDFLISKHCNLTAVDDNQNNLLHIACMEGRLAMVKHIIIELKLTAESKGQFGWTPVMITAYYGHTAIFKFLLNLGCNLSNLDVHKDNILHVACMGGHIDIVKFIVEKLGIGMETTGHNNRTVVLTAALYGHFSIIKYLVGKGCKLTQVDANGNNIVHLACVSGNMDMVKYILPRISTAIESKGHYGQTPAMLTASYGHVSLVKYLISKGCKLSITDSNGNNILHVASLGGSLDMVKYIISRTKIGIDSRGQYRRTPVMAAAYGGHTSVVKYLVGKGSKMSTVDLHGNNIPDISCERGSLRLVKYILSQTKSGIDSRGRYGRTPVMFALSCLHITIVKYLISEHCKLSLKDSNGNNILHMACMKGSLDLVKLFLSRKEFGVDSRGQYGRTPVMFAAYFGKTSVVKYLVRTGCKVTAVDDGGSTVFQIACVGRHDDVVKYLMRIKFWSKSC